MNALTRDLIRLTEKAEAEKPSAADSRFRQEIHLMPPTGWLNDPNGLCQFGGVFHAYFQYSPFHAEGGVKMWGHCTSRDMVRWEYQGAVLYPDQPFDCHGVYSGSAFTEDGVMYVYYTGNVKLEDRADYDYVNTGREANTVLVTSRDGQSFGPKQLLMRNADYPSDLTLHVRDPKVWKDQGTYYMIQGARTKADTGQALIFRSADRVNWMLHSRVETEEPFGYMWECPDYFEVNGVKLLSASVQGLEGGVWEDRNVYQSGYFLVEGDILNADGQPGCGNSGGSQPESSQLESSQPESSQLEGGQPESRQTGYRLSEYRLWDYGFDYYAPQSFETEDGRRIQIGWMGMPDCEDYTNPTIENGWQHCFTFPREIFVENGKVLQRPVRELEERERDIAAAEKGKGSISEPFLIEGYQVYDMLVDRISGNHFRAVLAEALVLEYTDGRFEMRFLSRDKGSVSAGRGLRYVEPERLESVRILADVSSVEVFLNNGEYVFTTRYYPERTCVRVEAGDAEIKFKVIESSS